MADSASGVFCIFDGCGGAGAVAQIALEVAEEVLRAHRDESDWRIVVDAFFTESDARVERARRDGRISGGDATTALVALVTGMNARIAHVGDCRAYLLRDGVLKQLTRDHTLVQDHIDAGTMTPAEAITARFRNVITRCVGFGPPHADLLEVELVCGDVVLLCSDGVWRYTSEDAIVNVLRSSSVEWATAITQLVADPGADNATAIVIRSVQDSVTRGSRHIP